jgi:hypothetical protein
MATQNTSQMSSKESMKDLFAEAMQLKEDGKHVEALKKFDEV